MMTEAEKELSRKLLNTQAEVLAPRDDMALMNGLILNLRGELDRLRQAVMEERTVRREIAGG